MPSSSGMSFTPHVIAVSVGEVCDQILVLFMLVEIVFNHHTLVFVFVRTLHQRYCLFRSKVQERLVSYLLVVQPLLQLFYSHHHLMELLNTRF